VEDVSGRLATLSVFGPGAGPALSAALGVPPDSLPPPGRAAPAAAPGGGGAALVVGGSGLASPGWRLLVPAAAAAAAWAALSRAGAVPAGAREWEALRVVQVRPGRAGRLSPSPCPPSPCRPRRGW
jgi:tRNA-modifying protein YgfZ